MTTATPTHTDLDEALGLDPDEPTSSETLTPVSLYRSPSGILLIHPDRHGQHQVVYGTSGFLYAYDPAHAFETGLAVEHLERAALPTWHGSATAPGLYPAYELRADTPEDEEVVLACVAPHATYLPAIYSNDVFRLLAEECQYHEGLPELSPVMGWLPLPLELEDLWG